MLFAALVLGALAGRIPARFTPPPILMYHRVDVDLPADRIGRSLTVTPAEFDWQLAYLHSQGLTGISMADFYRRLLRGRSLDRVIVLTFDDGYADQYRFALPLLRAYGDHATFYVVTGTLGRPGHLTWSELQAMSAAGMDIAAHGVGHADLTAMTPQQQLYQVGTSVRTLSERLDEPVESYAYPSGRFNRSTLAVVRASGLALAVTTDPSYVIPPMDRYELTRVRVMSEWNLGRFALALDRAHRYARSAAGR
jgi:peptidoglycan/xylan/chitin deacetylase (PgdA/CDA1 family)